jgi:hypothetical protein
MHSVTPKFRLAHSGSGAPQSAHEAFPGEERTRAKTASGSTFFSRICASASSSPIADLSPAWFPARLWWFPT